ncbi:MAG: tetratricopeptide repeat protein [Fimbriimonadaceae bacterium]|nr:tetratricopeptide repeat protein [Fimbriimonadaceae bacterium]
MRRILPCVAALLCAVWVTAQHGEMDFKNFTALPEGTLVEGIGKTTLKVTTKSEEARKLFEQGLCFYHGFHWTEAHRSFRDAVKIDPSFAMGWWGLHAVLQNPWYRNNTYKAEREGAIDRAVRMMEGCTMLEQDLIRSWKIWTSGAPEAFKEFEKSMLDICERNPQEVEPRVLLAGIYVQTNLSRGYGEDGKPIGAMAAARKLSQEALKLDPNSTGAHHYWIHACEGSPKPEDALDSAEKLGKIAWNCGHLIHMPGHIFYRCGLYDKAVNSFEAARKADEKYNKLVGTSSGNWNFFHNTDFFIAALVEVGRREEALKLAADSSRNNTTYILWRTSDFSKLNEMLEAKSIRAGALATTFFKAMSAFEAGKIEDAATIVDDIKSKAASSGKFDDDQFYRIEAETYLACASNDGAGVEALVDELEAVMKKQPYTEPPYYARPAAEGMGMALLKTSKLDLAKKCFDIALTDRANSPYSIYGLAQVAEKKGDSKEAMRLYRMVVDALKSGDADLPLFVAAKGKLEAAKRR